MSCRLNDGSPAKPLAVMQAQAWKIGAAAPAMAREDGDLAMVDRTAVSDRSCSVALVACGHAWPVAPT